MPFDKEFELTFTVPADGINIGEVESAEYKSCDNCHYEDKKVNQYPCSVCDKNDGTLDKWEPNEREKKLDTLTDLCDSQYSCEECPVAKSRWEICGEKNNDTLTEAEIDKMIEILSVPENDVVNRPAHYTDGNIEVIDFIDDKKLGFCLGNVVKYVARAGKKNPDKEIEDLEKAEWYLKHYIEKLKEAK